MLPQHHHEGPLIIPTHRRNLEAGFGPIGLVESIFVDIGPHTLVQEGLHYGTHVRRVLLFVAGEDEDVVQMAEAELIQKRRRRFEGCGDVFGCFEEVDSCENGGFLEIGGGLGYAWIEEADIGVLEVHVGVFG